MRTVAAVLALALAACTHAARTAPPAPSPLPPVTSAPAPVRRPARLAYVPDLAPGTHHTLVSAGGRLYVLDDSGRVVSSRWLTGGGEATLAHAGGTAYAAVSREGGPQRLWTYRDGVLTETGGGGYYLGRFASGGRTYRMVGDDVVRDAPRRRWAMPEEPSGYAPEAKGYHGGDGGRDVLATFTTPHGPVVVSALSGRCELDDLGRGLQTVLDAPLPWHWELCGAAAVDTDGRIVLLARDSGDYFGAGTHDRAVLLHVDLDTLAVVDRTVLTALPPGYGPDVATLVALPGGLVAYLRSPTGDWVVDLRGDRPVKHRLPVRNLGYATMAAGPDAFFVLQGGRDVARVTVSTGRVERHALHLPSYVTGVVRVR
jgi:hypothetical protein